MRSSDEDVAPAKMVFLGFGHFTESRWIRFPLAQNESKEFLAYKNEVKKVRCGRGNDASIGKMKLVCLGFFFGGGWEGRRLRERLVMPRKIEGLL